NVRRSSNFARPNYEDGNKRLEVIVKAVHHSRVGRATSRREPINLAIRVQQWRRFRIPSSRLGKVVQHREGCTSCIDFEQRPARARATFLTDAIQKSIAALYQRRRQRISARGRRIAEIFYD